MPEVHAENYKLGLPDSVLVLVFEKSKTFFSQKQTHSNIEIFMIPTPCPTISEPDCHAKSYDFKRSDILAIHLDRVKGVRSSVKRNCRINGESHDALCISLTNTEKEKIVDFVHAIKDCKYNSSDEFFSQTIPRVANFMTTDKEDGERGMDEEMLKISRTITKLHAGQLVTLIIQRCLHDKRLTSRMWGFNDRFTTPHDIYKELAGICLAINPDAFREGYIQAWGVGVSRTGPNRC